MSEIYLIALRLRALSRVLMETDHILALTDDCDYPGTMIDLTSDILLSLSEKLEVLSDQLEPIVKVQPITEASAGEKETV